MSKIIKKIKKCIKKKYDFNIERDRLQSFKNSLYMSRNESINLLATVGFYCIQNSKCIEDVTIICHFCSKRIRSGDNMMRVHSWDCILMTNYTISGNIESSPGKLSTFVFSSTEHKCFNFFERDLVLPRHQNFENLPIRFESFLEWPIQISQTPARMAKTGLFYTGYGDLVICFNCSIEISGWKESDDIVERHQVTGTCSFLNKMLRDEIESESTKKCIICLTRDVNATILPCSHCIMCMQCAAIMRKCPLCRDGIIDVLKTFL